MTKKLIPPTLEEFKKLHPPLRDVKKEIVQKMSKQDRIALWITNRIGTMGFFLIIVIWTFLWLGWNLLAPEPLRFDPPMGFVLWLFISNLIQIFLMPMIMVGQNVQERHADARAENDLEVNIKAEKEIEVILHHLEYQNAILIAMLEKQGINLEDALAKATKK
jgi:uncharacterized membrane protein